MKFKDAEFSLEELYYFFKLLFLDLKHLILSTIKKLIYYQKIKHKLGIVIAVFSETEEQKNRIENDLLRKFQSFLDQLYIPPLFEIVIVENKTAKEITKPTHALSHLIATRGKMIVYGNISTRMHNSKEHYSLRLETMILHTTADKNLNDKFSNEMNEIFPREILIPTDNEIIGFDSLSLWLSFAVEYIVAIGLFLSREYKLSYYLYKNLFSKLKDNNPRYQISALDTIKKRLKYRFTEISLAKCIQLYESFNQSRDRKFIAQMKEYLDLMKKHNPDAVYFNNLIAIYEFLINKNVVEAIKILGRSHNPKDDTWRYNLAFLYAFLGKLKKTKTHYDRATKVTNPSIISECEIFMSEVIDENPTKYELLFARGYLNFKIKGDYKLAETDLKKFLQQSMKYNKYSEEQELVKTYLSQIPLNIAKNSVIHSPYGKLQT